MCKIHDILTFDTTNFVTFLFRQKQQKNNNCLITQNQIFKISYCKTTLTTFINLKYKISLHLVT